MKITFILSVMSVGGGHRVVATYANELAIRGHEVLVIAPHRKSPSFMQRISSLIENRRWLPYIPYDDTHFRNSHANVKILKSSNPVTEYDVPDGDIVIATWWETAEWVDTFSSRKGTKLIFIQGYEAREGVPGDRIDRLKSTWRLPFHKIVISEWLWKLACDEFDDEPVALVPNGVDTGQFHTSPRSRQRIPTVGLVYSPMPFKGMDVALEAIDLVHKKIPSLKVVAFGIRPFPPDFPENTAYIQSPSQESIPGIYASCDVWLFPSRREGFGLPILEAMACRTPVIATPAGAAPELVSEGGGILVDHENPQAMATAIENLFAMNDAQWVELSDAALATAHRHSWDKAVDAFEEALIVAQGKPMKVSSDA